MKEYKSVKVNCQNPYKVLIGKGLSENVGSLISDIEKAKVLIITDNNVEKLYYNKVALSLESAGYKTFKFCVPNGERSKNINVYSTVLEFLAKNAFHRNDVILSLGGGVISDLGGFVASSYLRGIKHVIVSTTLLSQIDSAIGGKTAVNLDNGKNLAGTFYQPHLVILDINTLLTLPETEFVCGMGEGIKYALLNKRIFNCIKNGNADIVKFIYLCVKYKKRLVETDEKDLSKRRVLNLGHTFAHAIEKASNFAVPHGKAVSYGLKMVLDKALKDGTLKEKEYIKINQALKEFLSDSPYTLNDLINYIELDKKNVGDTLSFVSLKGIGKPYIIEINKDNILECLK